MFYPFNWFQKPRLFAAAKAGVMEWLRAGELTLYLESGIEQSDQQEKLEKRALSAAELDQLGNWIELAWEGQAFGGYAAARHLTDIAGLCYFKLNPQRTEARLAGLITSPEMSAATPLQSPILHLALIDLLWEVHDLQRLYLPFPGSGIEDQAILAAYGIHADDEPGWWNYNSSFSEGGRPVTSRAPREVKSWLELSLRVAPELFPITRLLLAGHGFMQRTIAEHGTKPGPFENDIIDETAPVTVRTYIPATDQAEAIIAKVRTALAYLAKLYPLPELEIAECSMEKWRQLWDDFDAFKVGKNILVTVLRPDYINKPGEIVVDINPTWGVFTPDRKGLHPTTVLSLELLEEHLDPARHSKLLDLGTGSGVLAIVAAKRGVPRILGLDANKLAVASARENIEHNGVADKIVVEAGSLTVLPHTREDIYSFPESVQTPPPVLVEFLPFDAIVANTLARVLIQAAGALAEALRPGGVLISGGIRPERADEVAAALEAVGFVLQERRQNGKWVGYAHIKAASFGSITENSHGELN